MVPEFLNLSKLLIFMRSEVLTVVKLLMLNFSNMELHGERASLTQDKKLPLPVSYKPLSYVLKFVQMQNRSSYENLSNLSLQWLLFQ
jgi:hypothetical protein